jgi:chromosomal replication initiation ATPase DnaA
MPLTEDTIEKWNRALTRLRASLGHETFEAWFSRLQLEDVRETRVYTSAPTNFLKKWIEKNYLETLLKFVKLELLEVEKVSVLLRVAGQPTHIPGDPEAEETEDESGPSEANSNTEGEEADPETGILKPPVGGKIGLEMIIWHACYHFKLKRAVMMKTRAHKIVLPRMIGMFLSKHMTERSLFEIGKRFDGRNHATVLKSIRKVERLIAKDTKLAFEVASLEATIRNRPLLT